MWSLGIIDASTEENPANTLTFTRGLRWRIEALKQLDDYEWDWLGIVQAYQDRGSSWGAIVEYADERYPSKAHDFIKGE
jgi:hypothetical protein